MIDAFTYEGLPIRVRFGRNAVADVAEEVRRLGAQRALVLTTAGREAQGSRIGSLLGEAFAGVFSNAVMHTPTDVTERALAVLRSADADCVIAVGGGSTTGLGKALALRTGVQQLCIPTTYAGSEMTPILGETKDGVKTTVRTLDVLPETVIYDVNMTLTLPPQISVTSGVNAIAHAVEALYAKDKNPIVSLMAVECVRAFGHALPAIVRDVQNLEARSDALYGAWLGGACLGLVGMALHHKLCHVLGGSFELPHAETHTVILPHAIAYNAAAAPEAMKELAAALGVEDAAKGLFDLIGKLGAPRSLRELGMTQSAIDQAADLAVQSPYWNPRPVERNAIRELIARAWAGEAPT